MKKLFLVFAVIALVISCALPTRAADVTLSILVPDAWVAPTIAAIKDKWPMPVDWYPGETQGVRIKLWTEHQMRIWLRNIVAPYKNEQDRIAALTASGYTPINDEDIPIEISQ